MGVIAMVAATNKLPTIASAIPIPITTPNGSAIKKFDTNDIAGKSPYITLTIGMIARLTAIVVIRWDFHAKMPLPLPLSPLFSLVCNNFLNGGASA